MKAIQGIYDNGKFSLDEQIPVKKANIVVLFYDEATTKEIGSAFGCLRKYANPSLIHEEGDAWERAVVEKYANN